MEVSIILAGFGGQGILFAGKVLAYCAMEEGKKLTWLPSYGPEMRGGTANCSVCISDDDIGSPIIQNPDILVAMNGPSYEKFIGAVKNGGKVFYDSSMMSGVEERGDADMYAVPASDLAEEHELYGGANMILLGKLLEITGLFSDETVERALKKCVAPKRARLIPYNMQAVALGRKS